MQVLCDITSIICNFFGFCNWYIFWQNCVMHETCLTQKLKNIIFFTFIFYTALLSKSMLKVFHLLIWFHNRDDNSGFYLEFAINSKLYVGKKFSLYLYTSTLSTIHIMCSIYVHCTYIRFKIQFSFLKFFNHLIWNSIKKIYDWLSSSLF